MNAGAWRRRGSRTPQRAELLSLRERAAFMQALRAAFASVVVAAAALMPGIVGASLVVIVAASAAYLVMTTGTQALARLGRERAQTILGGTLLLDGLYVAWVMSVTGGIESPFRGLVYVHIVTVTLLASYRTGLKIALWHTLLYVLLFEATVSGFALVSGGPLTEVVRSTAALRVAAWFQIGAFWGVALAAAAFSAIGERALRAQKIDLEQLSQMVAEMDQLERTTDIADVLLERLNRTFAVPRGVVLASPKDDLQLVATLGDTGAGPVEPGLDAAMDRAWASRAPVLVRRLDPSEDPRLTALLPDARNVLVLPMFADRGFRLGVLALEHPQGERIETWILEVIRQFTSHAAMAMHHAWLLDEIQSRLDEIRRLKDQVVAQNLSLESRVAEQTFELRQMVDQLRRVDEHRRMLVSQIISAQEEERQRIADDVHDDPAQRVIVVNMRLQLLRRALEDPTQIEIVDKLLDSVGVCIKSLRHLLFELRPPTLDEEGLGVAIRQYLNEREPEFDYRVDDLLAEQPPAETRIVLYRIAQEAITNAYKHASASNVTVKIEDHEGGFSVEIKDDGLGFGGEVPTVSAPGHLGLSSMRERAELAGGRCDIHSLPGEGTTVRIWLPDPGPEAGLGEARPEDDALSPAPAEVVAPAERALSLPNG
jgi:signal transduction histidine kinase